VSKSLQSPPYTLADFDFELPPDRIAQEPVRPRDSARLLLVGQELQDRQVIDLPEVLRPGDLLVYNDTKVIPAQLSAINRKARIGITLNQPNADGTWQVIGRNIRRLKAGDMLDFSNELSATVVSRDALGAMILRFNAGGEAFRTALSTAGVLALPPYIKRTTGPTEDDQVDYQTVFASNDGAVAAPTAGLHFTPLLLDRLRRRAIISAKLTLHVGAGTFLPVRDDDLSVHKMHPERGVIPIETIEKIRQTKARGGRIVAVGTTSLRLLESAATAEGEIAPFDSQTSLFITPGFQFRVVDLLMTNFHLPKSTLFVLVSAFAGFNRARAAYEHAIQEGYRFYSYGDSSLLERESA